VWFPLCWFKLLSGSNRQANGVLLHGFGDPLSGGAAAPVGALDLRTIQENKLAVSAS
jgi:hypothetical protein